MTRNDIAVIRLLWYSSCPSAEAPNDHSVSGQLRPPKFIVSGHLKEDVQKNHRGRIFWWETLGACEQHKKQQSSPMTEAEASPRHRVQSNHSEPHSKPPALLHSRPHLDPSATCPARRAMPIPWPRRWKPRPRCSSAVIQDSGWDLSSSGKPSELVHHVHSCTLLLQRSDPSWRRGTSMAAFDRVYHPSAGQ